MLKNKTLSQDIIIAWFDVLKTYPEKDVFNAIHKLSINSDDFINVGKVIEQMNLDFTSIAEKEWKEVLASAKLSGRLSITPRAGKALIGLGGMSWLRDSNPKNIVWDKKAFIDAFILTPEPNNIDFTVIGLEAPFKKEETDVYLLQ